MKQALKDARAAVKFGDKPGEVSAEVTRHADAKTIRKAKRLSGSQNQSAHALASGWLNKRVWRNGRLIKIAYNRMEALTQILNRKTHGFFDQHWKAFVRKTRRTGITRVPVSKMYDVMLDALLREPKGGGIKPLTAGQQSAFRILFDKEIADLGLRMTDVIEIPFID